MQYLRSQTNFLRAVIDPNSTSKNLWLKTDVYNKLKNIRFLACLNSFCEIILDFCHDKDFTIVLKTLIMNLPSSFPRTSKQIPGHNSANL